ncbi:MAG: DUF1294 domain-containing protein [Zoogloea sp.]|nr:MAG: DUF1294 domain-containing protein [Zoogloea sp.]
MRQEGILKTWNDDRGFGFIEPLHGGQEVFVHIKAFPARSARPEVGAVLSFEVELNAEGKKRATRVECLKARRRAGPALADSPARWGTATYLVIPAFFVVAAVAAHFLKVPARVAGWYGLMSLVCFAVYAWDKSAAVAGRRRVPERTLLMLGLLGGWPGAIVAQQSLRHKSSKPSFRARFWLTVLGNSAGFVGLFMLLRGLHGA